jgi:predicted transcriptional regulator
MATTIATLELNAQMAERIKQVAANKNSTADQIMQQAIEQYVSRAERQEQFRLDTLASLEHYDRTGLHLTDEEVGEWIAKLEAGEDPEPLECHT